MKLNETKKLDLFLKRLESFAAPEVCYNLQGGGHCKYNCLHVLWDVNIWTAVAQLCVQFSELKKNIFYWIESSTQACKSNKEQKAEDSLDEVSAAPEGCLHFCNCVTLCYRRWQMADGRWEMVIDPWPVNEVCNCQATWQYKKQFCQDTRR